MLPLCSVNFADKCVFRQRVYMRYFRNTVFGYCLLAVLLPNALLALEMEPRKWSHLPMGVNFAGIAYAYTEADIGFDPVLELENVEMEKHTWAGKYIRTFELLNKSARIDLTQGYQKAK